MRDCLESSSYLRLLSSAEETFFFTMSDHPTNHNVSETEKNVKLACYVVTFLLGLFGNISILFILRKKSRKTTNDVLIVNLAVADVTLLALSLPASILWFCQAPFPDFFCRFVVPCMTSMYNVSIFTMTVIAVQRCHVIRNSPRPAVRRRSMRGWIAATWGVGVLLLVPAMVVSQAHPADGSCRENWDSAWSRGYTASLFVAQYAAPLSTISIAYVLIAMELRRSERHCAASTPYLERRRKEDVQIMKVMATLVLLFAVCMLPVQAAWLLTAFGTESQQRVGTTLLKFADVVAYLQTFLDPIVYGTLMKSFRVEYGRLVKDLFRSGCCISPMPKPVTKATPKSPHIHQRDTSRPGNQLAERNGVALPEGSGTTGREVRRPPHLETEL